MIIGIPKEIMHDERRVSAIPETVASMIKDGHTVLFEKGAGVGSFYADALYESSGAKLIDNVIDIFDKADVILKVKEPLFNEKLGKHEVDLMHEGQCIITFIHPASPVNHEMVKKMAANGIIGLTLDGIPRISRAQNMDALSSMSTCAGYKGMLMAADTLPKFIPMIGSAVGMIRPSTAFVIGTGVAGLRAVATAKALGAIVYSADIRPDANEQAMSLGAKIVDTGVPKEIAVSADGKHANKLSDEWLEKERANLADMVKKADIIFCSALLLGKQAPLLLTEDMVKTMKPGSTIIDISIDQGGNCSITPPGKIETKHDVVIQGIKNIPGMLPTSSTWMFANNIYNLLKFLVQDDKINIDTTDEIINGILVCANKELVHAGAKEAMGIK
ncbi:MAG TPA: NAD(P) transhydrogenase subunit alpha [Clostridia bacterium]|nr:NAD(P) transhydrogenase subunit alpha [Clostridia bacterium]